MSRLASELSQYCQISSNGWRSALGETSSSSKHPLLSTPPARELICLVLLQGSHFHHRVLLSIKERSRAALCYLSDSLEEHTAILYLHFPNPRGWHSLLGANAPEITLNTNQVKVKANKNIYLQNIKSDNIVTGIYKDTHSRKERKLW